MLKYALGLYCLAISACQMGYILQSAQNQFSMMAQRENIEDTLKNNKLNDEQKRKLRLSQQARDFALNELQLKETDNYKTFINLKRPYVSWVVHAAYKWELKNYEWSYPLVGKMPYKGFFTEQEALDEAALMEKQGYDTLVRGVSAYSTLGYFTDSVLSSMLRYKDYDLVNTIIHETVHTTLYIKNNADFNERLAVFIGAKGTELFYKKLEGPNSATLKTVELENADEQLFSKFIGSKIIELNEWYKQNQKRNESERNVQFEKIKKDFNRDLALQLKTKIYEKFKDQKINNAYLGLYKTYNQNLDDFEIVYNNVNRDILKFIEMMKTLEKSENPEQDLKKLGEK